MHLYQKNADEIVDAYLAIPRNQERFSNLPNVRQILKTQIAKKQDSNFLDENTARLLRNTVEYHGLIREPATLDSLPFLKEPDVLNKFFDEHPLNVARDLMMREKYSKQFAFENKGCFLPSESTHSIQSSYLVALRICKNYQPTYTHKTPI